MSLTLIPPEYPPEAVTIRLADELARELPPSEIVANIRELMTAMRPAKKKGEMPVINERARESGLKMYALFQQLADNARKNGAALPPPRESDEDVILRLLASPAALRASLALVARHPEGRRVMREVLSGGEVIEMEASVEHNNSPE